MGLLSPQARLAAKLEKIALECIPTFPTSVYTLRKGGDPTVDIEEPDKERDSKGCERMAEMMRTLSRREAGAIDCHSFMRRMMGAGTKKEKAQERERTS